MSASEKLICSDSKLSALDDELAKVYQTTLTSSRLGDNGPIASAQRGWLKDVRDKCLDVSCMAKAYSARLKMLREVYPFFGVYQGVPEACLGEFFKFTPDTISLAQVIDTPYDILASDETTVTVRTHETTTHLPGEIILSRYPLKNKGERQPKGLVLIEVDSCTFASADPGIAEDQTANFMHGKTAEDRKRALDRMNIRRAPDVEKHNKTGLRDPSPKVRADAAYKLHINLDELTPLLLSVMTNDSDRNVRLSASLNLSCQFTCNGVEVEPKDIVALESDIPLLIRAIRNETSGRYVVEILDNVWCDMSPESRAQIIPVLESRLPNGDSAVSVDGAAKSLLRHHSGKCL